MAFSSCTLVAASTRTSIGMLLREPRRTTSRSCNTRSNLTWIAIGKSPISSRNNVPPSASSNQPALALRAPVNAPFSWPNSSASTSDSENAPQFTATNGRLRRALRLWIWRATSSLPVPVSPMISTLASLGATCWIWSSSAWDFGSSKTWAVARIEVARAGEGGKVKSCMGTSLRNRTSESAGIGSTPSPPVRGVCSPPGRAGFACAGCASAGPGAARRGWSARR